MLRVRFAILLWVPMKGLVSCDGPGTVGGMFTIFKRDGIFT